MIFNLLFNFSLCAAMNDCDLYVGKFCRGRDQKVYQVQSARGTDLLLKENFLARGIIMTAADVKIINNYTPFFSEPNCFGENNLDAYYSPNCKTMPGAAICCELLEEDQTIILRGDICKFIISKKRKIFYGYLRFYIIEINFEANAYNEYHSRTNVRRLPRKEVASCEKIFSRDENQILDYFTSAGTLGIYRNAFWKFTSYLQSEEFLNMKIYDEMKSIIQAAYTSDVSDPAKLVYSYLANRERELRTRTFSLFFIEQSKK